jgi:opacity protein-like surface antigen
MITIRFAMPVLWLFSSMAAVSPASAQPANASKWEIEIHGGGIWPTNPADGTTSLPGPGQVFTTATTMPTPPPTSRRESSWYFGDGAVLFNQSVVALFSQAAGDPRTPPQIATLDPVLSSSFAVRDPGASVGLTVSRVLTPRLSAELVVDYSRLRLHITQSNSDAIEATRASFITAFEGMIRFNPNRVLNSVTSTDTRENGSGHQLAANGALTINLRTAGNVIPYATLGAGLIATSGEMAETTLLGNYQFRLGAGGAPINETDSVTVRAIRDHRTFAGILGGGVKYHVSPRWGIRLGLRVAFSKNSMDTVVDAAPSVTLGLQPAGRGALGGNPSIQFSNSTDPVTALGVTAVAASSLTGPAISGFRTFAGSGTVSHTSFTTGIFWRF